MEHGEWFRKACELSDELRKVQQLTVKITQRQDALEAENNRLKGIIVEAKIVAAALAIAEMPSVKGLREIATILNKGIDLEGVQRALKAIGAVEP